MPFDAPDSESLPKIFQQRTLPDGWRTLDLSVDGLKLNCYEVGDPSSPVRIGLALGHKGPAFPNNSTLEHLIDGGFSAAVLELPHPGKSLGFMDSYAAAIEQFYFNRDSPLFNHNGKAQNIVGMTHSTSGLLVEDHMLNPLHARFAKNSYSGFLHVAPIYDTANSSQLFHQRFSRIYTWHAGRNSDTLCGDAPGDQMYIQPNENNPTHGQAIEIRDYARAHQERALRLGNKSTLSRKVLIGSEDGAACHKTAEFMADTLNIPITILPGKDHNLLSNDPTFASDAIDAIWSLVPGTPPHLRSTIIEDYELALTGDDGDPAAEFVPEELTA